MHALMISNQKFRKLVTICPKALSICSHSETKWSRLPVKSLMIIKWINSLIELLRLIICLCRLFENSLNSRLINYHRKLEYSVLINLINRLQTHKTNFLKQIENMLATQFHLFMSNT